MGLQDLVANDVDRVLLNTNDWATSGTLRTKYELESVTFVLHENQELEHVRRATVWTSTDTTVSVGDEFLSGSDTWVVLHTDIELGAQRSHCHYQLSSTVTVKTRSYIKQSGAQEEVETNLYEQVRAEIVKHNADLEFEGKRRQVQQTYTIYLNEPLYLDHNDIVQDDDTGKRYRVLAHEKPEQFERLFRLRCEVEE